MRRPSKGKKISDNTKVSSPEETRRRIFQRAVKLLAAKARSIAELRERLLEGRGADDEVVETVISRLRQYGYLDDEHFAVSYASLRVKQRPVGRRRLERDLTMKKVDRSVAKSLFDHLLRQGFAFELVSEKVRAAVKVDLSEE